MLVKRILTAAVGIPIAVYIINYGQWLFTAAIMLLALLAWYEYGAMLRMIQIRVLTLIGTAFVFLLQGCAWLGNSYESQMLIFLFTVIVLVTAIFRFNQFTITDSAFNILGIIYIGMSFAHFILLRFIDHPAPFPTPLGELSPGTAFLLMAFFGTWASDTFAYFVGSFFGKHKLCPAVSPGKTVEGAMGGLLGSIAVVVILGTLLGIQMIHSGILGLVVGIAAPLGDLAESVLKRFTGVKDSGKILPGHGGVLDRFDSVIFAVPAVYYYIYLFMF